jgi:hypothetical protein
MNEKIVDWFEDLIPEIKKSGDVKEVFLKFANKKNLAPALLEKLGQVYNTAKTVNYLDKSASDKRGDSFKVLDVEDLLEAYTKEAKSDYSNNSFSSLSQSKRVPKDLFGGMVKEIPVESSLGEQEIKLASDIRNKFKKECHNKTNTDTLNQLVFELKEDIRDLAEDFSGEIQTKSANFDKVEQDALYYFEGNAKEACDMLASYLEDTKYLTVKRASDSGKSRLVEDYASLNLIGQIQNKINELGIAKKAEFQKSHLSELSDDEQNIKSAHSAPTVNVNVPKDKNLSVIAKAIADGGGGSGGGSSEAASASKKKDLSSGSKGEGLIGALGNSDIVQKGPSSFKDFLLGSVAEFADTENKDQKEYDLNLRDVEQAAVLQNLLATDEILADADPEKVVEAYNTLRQLAPELASDINVARVTLRSMVQHDGLAIFDAQQYSSAEMDAAKVDNNRSVTQQSLYGKKDDRENVQKRLSS